MKNKGRLLVGLLALLLVLCACRENGLPSTVERERPLPLTQGEALFPEDPLSSEWDPLPEVYEGEVWIQGKRMEERYVREGEIYLPVGELCAALGATEGSLAGQDPRKTIALRFPDGGSLAFSTQGEGESHALFVKEKGFLLPGSFLLLRGLRLYTHGAARYYTAYPTGDSLPEGVRVPVLMYHAVSDRCEGVRELYVSPSSMEEQLRYLRDNGYTTLLFEELSRADEVEKPVLLTFDDGYRDNYTQLFPLLQQYGAKANIFVITGWLGGEHYLTEEQVREMQESGLVSFQSHTVSHPYLDECTEEELHRELSDSKAALARLTGREPFVLCYPFGRYDDMSLRITREYYSFGLLMQDGRSYTTDDDPYHIRRAYVRRSSSLKDFAAMVSA